MARRYVHGAQRLPTATTEDLNLLDSAWDLGTFGKPVTLRAEYTISDLTCSALIFGCSSHSANNSNGFYEITLNKT